MIHGGGHRNTENHRDFVIGMSLGLEPHAFTLQFRQTQKLFLNEPEPLALQRLLLGTGRGIDIRLIRHVPVVTPGGPNALVLPPGIDP